MKLRICLLLGILFCLLFFANCNSENQKNISFISFDEVLYKYKVELNNEVPEPNLITKDGYSFMGWYEDEEYKNQFYFNELVTSDKTFYAKWLKTTDLKYFDYEVLDGKLTIVIFNYLENSDEFVVIPQMINGEIVKAINSGIYNKEDSIFRTYIIPEGVEEIGEYCFYESKVAAVFLPRNLKKIHKNSFSKAFINKVYINNESSIFEFDDVEETPFSEATINEFYYPNQTGKFVFRKYRNMKITNLIIQTGIEEIVDDAFDLSANMAIANIIFPNTLKVIGQRSCMTLKNLKRVVLPNSLEVIKKNAFMECEFTFVRIPNGVKTLEEGAFANVMNAYIPGSIEKFEPSVFGYYAILLIDLEKAKDSWGEGWNNSYRINWLKFTNYGEVYG